METEHTEGVVGKAVAYVKDMLGIPPADKRSDGDDTPSSTDSATGLTANEYTFKTVAEVNAESARREDGE